MNEEIKQFLRDNLEIVIEFETNYNNNANQTVGIRIKGDDDCFSEQTVCIGDI